MTTKLVALVLLCLMSGTAMAQEAKVTPLMSKDLAEYPGSCREVGGDLGDAGLHLADYSVRQLEQEFA